MGNERSGMASHISEVPGCIGGLIGDVVRITWPIALVGGLTFLVAEQEGHKAQKIPTTSTYGEGKLVATPVPVSPTAVEQVVVTQPSANHCLEGKDLVRHRIRVTNEQGQIVEGWVSGADNYWSVRDDEGENKFITVFCDEVKGNIVALN